MGARAAQQPLRPGEGLLAAQGFMLSGTQAQPPTAALSPDGLGALHAAVYATLTRAFDRHDGLVAAGRELVLVAAICSALLLWRTARRLGLGVATSTVVVLGAGLPPLILPAALLDVPAQLAVPWLLLATWLLAPGRSTVAARVVALAATTAAVLLAPDVLLLVLAGAAASIGTGRLRAPTEAGVRPAAALPLVAGLVAGFAAAALLLPRWDPQPEASALGIAPGSVWALTLALVLTGAAGAWWPDRLRAPGIALIATTLAAVAVHGRLSALLVCLPVAALVGGARARTLAARLSATGRRTLRMAGAGALVCAAVVALVLLVRASDPEPGARDVVALLNWTESELPSGAALVAPQPMWAELIHAGGHEDEVRLPGTAGGGGALDPVLTVVRGRPPEGDLLLARFDGPGTAAPLLVVDPDPGAPTPGELDRRRSLAAALLANPTTGTAGRAAEVLRAGAVDQRLLSVLAALAAQFGVEVRDLPLLAGEPAEGSLARRALVGALGGQPLTPGAPATARLVAWLEAQQPPFAPDSVTVTDDGVLIAFHYVSAPDALVSRSAP